MVRTEVASINRYSAGARGVIVMRLNAGDQVAGIAVFRAGLAEHRALGDNGEAPRLPRGSPGRTVSSETVNALGVGRDALAAGGTAAS